jgi:hypothetical protein
MFSIIILSIIRLKELTWSMAHGIKHGRSLRLLNMRGKLELKLGAAWTAGKPIFPMQSLSTKPNMFFTWFRLTHFWMRNMFL